VLTPLSDPSIPPLEGKSFSRLGQDFSTFLLLSIDQKGTPQLVIGPVFISPPPHKPLAKGYVCFFFFFFFLPFFDVPPSLSHPTKDVPFSPLEDVSGPPRTIPFFSLFTLKQERVTALVSSVPVRVVRRSPADPFYYPC